jgi:ubiquinone/menaquinone biosynthesis C-methylase UbiE
MEQDAVSAANARFWDELCGSGFAQSLGITEPTQESLRRFDAAYLAFYPYLLEYVPVATLPGKRVLEIGLGYGTLGQLLAGLGVDYTGLDIAAMPVSMMQQRLEWLHLGEETARAVRASALDMPFEDASFDMVYAIGSLHHTGDLPRALAEVRRVLRPGGTTVFMVYNARSFRRATMRARALKQQAHGRLRRDDGASERARYDANAAGEAAPHTDFVTRHSLRATLRELGFSTIRVQSRNWDDLWLAGRHLPRAAMLGTVDRLAGLDLYVTATLT